MAKTRKLTQEQRDEIRTQVLGQLNIKTEYTPYEGEARTSSFSEEPAAWRRGNRLYSEAEYQRTNARRIKLEARAQKLIDERIVAAEAGEVPAQEAEAVAA